MQYDRNILFFVATAVSKCILLELGQFDKRLRIKNE